MSLGQQGSFHPSLMSFRRVLVLSHLPLPSLHFSSTIFHLWFKQVKQFVLLPFLSVPIRLFWWPCVWLSLVPSLKINTTRYTYRNQKSFFNLPVSEPCTRATAFVLDVRFLSAKVSWVKQFESKILGMNYYICINSDAVSLHRSTNDFNLYL